MPRELRTPLIVSVVGIVSILALSTLLPMFVSATNTDTPLQPHAQCLLYTPALIGAYTVSDLMTGLSYMVISLFLLVFVHRARRDIPFNWIFLAFGGFIFFCGLTHFFDVITLWTPVYWSSVGIRALTAVSSVTTALALPPLMPRVLRMIEDARASDARRRQLVATNEQLAAEIETRRGVEHELRDSMAREQALAEFRTRVIIRLSHELRTPLAIAQTASDLLKQYFDRLTESQRHERLNTIQQQIAVITRLLRDILTVGRYADHNVTLYRERVDLAALTAEELAAQHAALEAGAEQIPPHRIDYTPPESGCADVEVDPQLIRSIMSSLISNAAKYSPPHSPITVTLTCSPTHVILSVRDQGIGIPQEEHARIFESFYRAGNVGDIPGTGMGLAIVKMAVDLHGGTVAVKSEVGQGAMFTVTLPLPLQAEGGSVGGVSPLA